MEYILLLLMGAALIVAAIQNFKGNISTVHRYNRRRVSKEDAPRYGRAMGLGTMIIGVSTAATAVLQMIFDAARLLTSIDRSFSVLHWRSPDRFFSVWH